MLILACTRKAKCFVRSWVGLLPPQVVALCSTSDIPYSNPVNIMVAKITETQGQYLSFISQYMKVNGRSPAESDIQRYFGVSPPTVHQMVVKLENLGMITRQPGVARSIRIIVSRDSIPELK